MPFLDFSYGVVPSRRPAVGFGAAARRLRTRRLRRHSPAPVRHDHRNEIVQALDAHEPGPEDQIDEGTWSVKVGEGCARGGQWSM